MASPSTPLVASWHALGRGVTALAACAAAAALAAQPAAPLPAPLTYADWADLALASDVVADATVTRASALGARAAPDVPAGEVRVLVTGALNAALKAPRSLPPGGEWLWQGPGTKRQMPFGKGAQVLVFARISPAPAAKDALAYQLVSPAGQQPRTEEAARLVRQILKDASTRKGAVTPVERIDDANVAEGTVPGARLTQFFLATRRGRPVTLIVRRASGQAPAEVTATTSDLLSDATPIAPATLTWYVLACGMPRTLPADLAADSRLSADYQAARDAIGPCARTLTPPPPARP